MKRIRTDLCVIGAGSGGLSVAAGAAQMGASVVLIEAGEMGGDCLNHGCVPSKTLIAAGKRAHAMQGGPGVEGVTPRIDYAAAQENVARVIADIAPIDSQERFEGLGVHVIRAHARFTSPREVEAGGQVITARRFVVATGSSPFIPPLPGLEDVPYLTNESIFGLREAPGHLLILGGGPIGMEMAQAHRRLGCAVAVVEANAALAHEDPEMAAIVLARLRAEGVEIIEGQKAERVSRDGTAITLHLGERVVRGTHLLVAVGRRPGTEGLGLEAAGVEYDKKGVTVGANLRSTNRRIYAVGDVAGQGQFTHLASYHANIVIRQIMFGLPARARKDHIPRVTYTDPELAQVGMTEAEARKVHGEALQVIRVPMEENDRARTDGVTGGMIKLMVHRGRAVGVTIVGAHAGELIGIWALVLAQKLRLSAVAGTVLPYPTLSEINKRAAGAYFSPKLFDNPMVKRVVGLVQRILP